MRHFNVVLAIFVLLMGGLAVVTVLTRNKSQSAQIFPNTTTASPSATLIVLAPPVQVKRGDSWEEATGQQIIYAGQSVRTLGLGKADVLFEGIGTLRLDQKTEITLSSLTAKAVLIAQGIGNTYSKVIKFFDSEQKYEVETPTAVASVRGTAFGVLVDSTYKTSVIVTSNTVAVAPIVTVDGEKKRLPAAAVPEGQATQINKEVIRHAQQEGIPPPVVSKEVLVSPVLRQWFEENKTKDEEFDRQEQEEKIESATPSDIRHQLRKLVEPIQKSIKFISESLFKSDTSEPLSDNEPESTPEPIKFIETSESSDTKRSSKDDKDKPDRATPLPQTTVSVSPSSDPEPTKFIKSPEPSGAEQSLKDYKDRSEKSTPSPQTTVSASPLIIPNLPVTSSDILDQLQKFIIKPFQKLFGSPSDDKPDDNDKKDEISTPKPTKSPETSKSPDAKQPPREDDKDKPDRPTPSPQATDKEEE